MSLEIWSARRAIIRRYSYELNNIAPWIPTTYIIHISSVTISYPLHLLGLESYFPFSVLERNISRRVHRNERWYFERVFVRKYLEDKSSSISSFFSHHSYQTWGEGGLDAAFQCQLCQIALCVALSASLRSTHGPINRLRLTFIWKGYFAAMHSN